MSKKSSYAKSEASLRDYLSANLHLIEPGLKLVAKEHPLPNTRGARGYIDILARDELKHRVVIEIKRSNATARQALHELHKYVELLQANQGLSNADVRCIVISTDWHELTVPFGQYQRTAKYPVEGFEVVLANGNVTGLRMVSRSDVPTPIRPFRLHTGHFFMDEKSATSAMPRIRKGLDKAGVTSAVIVEMHLSVLDEKIIYPYCLYVMIFDVSEKARQKYMARAKGEEGIDPNDPNEVEYMFEQEALCVADEGVRDKSLKYTRESSSPEKFAAMMETWKINQISRTGRMRDESLFTDDDLRGYLLGFMGTGQIAYNGTASPAYPAAWEAAKRRVRRCLVGSQTWEQIAEHVFKLVEAMPGRATARFHIYNPCDTVMALFKLVGRNDPRFIPKMEIMWKSDVTEDRHVVSGVIARDGTTKPKKPKTTLNRIFQGDAFGYFLARNVGEIAAFDVKVMRALGLSYQAAHFVLQGEKDKGRWLVTQKDHVVERGLKMFRHRPFPYFIKKNIEFVQGLVDWCEENSVGL